MKRALLSLLLMGYLTACDKEQADTASTIEQGTTVVKARSNDVWLCHKPEGQNPISIWVDASSVASHLAHGDVLLDADGDGYTAVNSCGEGTMNDCNDNDAAIHPGATEVCDGIDNNCNGQTDEGVKTTFYADADGDGYGNAAVSQQACSAPEGYVTNNTDCNDSAASAHPGAEEVCGDGLDNDCDGNIDEGCPLLVSLPSGETLYVHPTDNNAGITWGGYGSYVPGVFLTGYASVANTDFAGEANTQAIVEFLGADNYAAKICADLDAFGYTDWYLPSAGELNRMYQQLGPPGSQQITSGLYWGSTEAAHTLAWVRNFGGGPQLNEFKSRGARCRCVRK